MLKYTFQHIRRISAQKEKELWRNKIFTWEDYENYLNTQLSFDFAEPVTLLSESKEKLKLKNADFFTERLSPNLYYRIPHTFPEKTIFLDIETTGLSRYYDKITIVGWSILDKYKTHIIGNEKTKNTLLDDLKNSNCIVTFNGAIFDIPFLKIAFSDVQIPKCHVDLRFFCRRIGLQGGQKNIENVLKLKRPKELKDVDGLEATILWHRYKEGNLDSLKKLILYNSYDIEGMKVIFEKATKLLLKKEKSSITYKEVFPFSNFKTHVEFTGNKRSSKKIFIEHYKGKVGPLIFINDLKDLSNLRIVGIDLTGSESRASGWALLENNSAITKTILTDQEIIEETIKTKPAIISIDSPLSLPIGRISVFDNDPGRNKYGITRECERIMAKRGVKSYPCLIPSMQKLTARGIILANEFRKLGYPVIESYPGAAQDILGIPRKRKSMEFLIKGLHNFGIKGDYITEDLTHDEIDAITSALVGYFFLADRFEALGNENEDYLIIPKLEKNIQKEKKLVVGFSGLLSSGKTTSGEILQNLGFAYGRYSKVIESLLRQENVEVNRTNLQMKGEYVNKEKGQRWLGSQLLKFFPKDENLVIDGLRFAEDHSFLRERFGLQFYHIHLTSERSQRKERYSKIQINDKSFEDADAHNVENEVNKLSGFADIVLPNDTSLSDLENQLTDLINKLCQSQ